MSFPFIVLGDCTDHGGEVIEASGMTDTHGKPIARMGDKVSCPKCRGSKFACDEHFALRQRIDVV